MIKILTATLFSASIEVDEQNKIINASKGFENFKGLPFSTLENILNRNHKQYQSLRIIDVEDAQ
jgi:bifunctional DNase/RNase